MTPTLPFSRTVLISLARRRDRTEACRARMAAAGFDPGEVWLMDAVDGLQVPPPAWWRGGPGAWGCYLSHVRAMEDFLATGQESLLVLEDDVCWRRGAPARLKALMGVVPADWDQLYLGGQHLKEPILEGPGLYRGLNVNRTHAYALSREGARKMHQHLSDWSQSVAFPKRHVDHLMGQFHEKRKGEVWCPEWWLAGQVGGDSDIGRKLPTMYWENPSKVKEIPFVWCATASEAWAASGRGFHFGNNLEEGVDVGLPPLVGLRPDIHGIYRWCMAIAKEALGYGTLPAAWCPGLGLETLRMAWRGACTIDEARDVDFLVASREDGL